MRHQLFHSSDAISVVPLCREQSCFPAPSARHLVVWRPQNKFRPAGTIENSPAFQRRVICPFRRVPQGRLKTVSPFQPSRRDSISTRLISALKRRAIFIRRSATTGGTFRTYGAWIPSAWSSTTISHRRRCKCCRFPYNRRCGRTTSLPVCTIWKSQIST